MNNDLIIKIIKMFRPCRSDFCSYKKEDVIQGPNDRAIIGFDTYFPIEYLVEDYGFTEAEAREFVRLVNEYAESEVEE